MACVLPAFSSALSGSPEFLPLQVAHLALGLEGLKYSKRLK